jgi:hypothetical protein
MRLIKAASHDVGILACRGVRTCGARRHWGCGRYGCWRRRDLLAGSLSCCRVRCRLLFGVWSSVRLAMRDELCIAWSARPWRRVGRQPAGPMRPMVGDKAAATREIERESDQSCRSNEPLGGHKACRMFGATISLFRSPGMDSIRGGTMVRKSHAL